MIKKISLSLLSALIAGMSLSLAATLPRPEYPRPQFERSEWINLNGTWTYTFDFGKSGLEQGFPASEGFNGQITVPFCPESELSGVGYNGFIPEMWYQRKVVIPAAWAGKRILLHFGAVDYHCTLYVNGKLVGRHWGGTVSFEMDITGFAPAGQTANLVLRVEDDVRSSVQPLGKQSTHYDSYGCWYTRTTGIWQTVWMEAVDPCGLKSVYVKPDLDGVRFIVEPRFYALSKGQKLQVTLYEQGTLGIYPAPGTDVAVFPAKPAKPLAVVTAAATDAATLVLPVPERKLRTWSPSDPYLYDLKFEVIDAGGNVIDQVISYAGLRKVHIEGNRIYLNNKPLYLRMVLDQGFYPDGIWTAPGDQDLRADIERSMAVGFNAGRLHQKVFEERFHYWADRLGYLTWGEAASWGFDTSREEGPRNFISEWEEIVIRDRNHPSIIVWTPFNETQRGEGELAQIHDRMITDVYRITHALDYRPVHDASGGYHVLTDIWSEHIYDQDSASLVKEQTPTGDDPVPAFNLEQEFPYLGQPYFIDEYGGIKWVTGESSTNGWGYGSPESIEEVYTRISALTDAIRSLDYVSGFCYTQLTDVEQEQNGIYTYDRKLKFDAERLRAILSVHPAWAEE